MKLVYFVRHGESEANVQTPRVVGGRSSWAELTPRGVAQARALGRRWRQDGLPRDRVVASTAIRAQQTARYCLEAAAGAINEVETYPELEELDQGDWTGRVRNEVYTPEQVALIEARQWIFRPPGGESQDDVYQRTARWLQATVLPSDHTHTWVFCHGMVIKLTLTGLTGLDRTHAWRMPIDNGSITTLAYRDQEWVEVARNDALHCRHLLS